MKNFQFTILQFSICILVVVAGFLLINNDSYHSPSHIKYIKIAGQDIKVELAITPAQQEQGLSGRNELKENEGMLFAFPQPGKYYFWMKDMNFPIDMIWIGKDMRIIYIKKDARPESYPETYGPGKDAKYILEVVSGFSEKNNLKEDNKVEFISN